MKKNSSGGFTFLELLIVMIIILILATFAFPVFISVQERASITKDMSNLRQIGFATQRYLTDNDGVLFRTTTSWMKQLCPGPTASTQYLNDWGVFQSPWDTRIRLNTDATTPVSYGINGNPGVVGIDTSKIVNPVAFIFFGSAQASTPSVSFQGTAAFGTITVFRDTSNPGGTVNCGTPNCGTQQKRKRISAVCADGHAENMLWVNFIRVGPSPSDPNAELRWSPYLPYP